MLNYGNSNGRYSRYGATTSMGYPGDYNITGLYNATNPFYSTSYQTSIAEASAKYDVNTDGYMWYRYLWAKPGLHKLYRGGGSRSGLSGQCETLPNGARDLLFDFNTPTSGGLAVVASNYIDMFTKFYYYGGTGSGIHAVPGMGALHGEAVQGYGLFIKSQFNGTGNNYPEERRATCEGCNEFNAYPMGDGTSLAIPEMTYIGFHDDARILTQNQRSWLEAPVIEFFGHAEFNTNDQRGSKTNITLKADSLVFHDSVIFDNTAITMMPYTTGAQRANDMRYGVINDRGASVDYYSKYSSPAIQMADRGTPVLELGYQRCNEPRNSPHTAPNERSVMNLENTPTVGGDIIVTFKNGYRAPMFNTVVANHARISFITDSFDNVSGGEYVDAFIRTDLLRIRNKVQFYTEPGSPTTRSGKFVMATPAQMDNVMVDPGMYTRHLHMEPGSELSIPGEDSLVVLPTTVVGGYGHIHENVFVKANGILAPGFASLMEGDCQTPYTQGSLTVHNLQMEKDAILRVSMNGSHVDTLIVQDSAYLEAKVPVVVLPERYIEPGCYLFMMFTDTTISNEYVHNFELTQLRYEEFYYSLYFEAGKVYLCVSEVSDPVIRHYIDLPDVTGVITNPSSGWNFVFSRSDFNFTANFTGTPQKVIATGVYSGDVVDLDYTAKNLGNNVYQYTIGRVLEHWVVSIGPDVSTVSNGGIQNQKVWAYKNTLYINADRDDIVSIYNMTGVLRKKVEIPEGLNTFTLERGVYMVTLKDGSDHKIIIQ